MSNYRLLLCFLLLPLLLPAQRDKLERAQREFAVGAYAGAMRTLRSEARLIETDEEAALLLAVSEFHAGDLLAAEERLLRLASTERGLPEPLSFFYLGRIYHAQHQFARAAVEYKRYLRSLGSADTPERRTAINLLRNCDNGIRAGFVSDEMVAENLGAEINGEHDEYGPIPSPSGSGRLYFSLTRPVIGQTRQQSDIVVSTNEATGWGAPVPLNPLINTDQHESLVDISPNGQRLYYYRGSNERNGSFFVDTFQYAGTQQVVTLPLIAPLSAANGDATPFFGAPDGIYFASDRDGGYGGLDLYRLPYLPGGRLGPAENLGPNVNTPYDEVTPFVALDGRTLYYSTNDPTYSVGGFDVVRTQRVSGADLRFVRPENAGMPLNSAGDETHFRLASDTFTAFLASDRKDGYGRRDLYIVYFIEPRTEMQPGR